MRFKIDIMKFCVIIPSYNSDKQIESVLNNVLEYIKDIIVVNDGSTDNTLNILKKYPNIRLITYANNRGKGYALNKGFIYARNQGFSHVITLDSDGQHKGKDILNFIQKAIENPQSIIVGCRWFENPNMPESSRFANKFSNFWFRLQTGISLPDTQNGFRLYPLAEMSKIKPFTSRYETELELLVRSAWRGISLIPQRVEVYYPPKEMRVSHFRKGKDFFRISILNLVLTFLAAIYGYPSIFIRRLFRK